MLSVGDTLPMVFLWEKNKTTMNNAVKELLGDIPLEIDNRVTLIHLDTIRFARLKTHEYKAVSRLFLLICCWIMTHNWLSF